MSVYITGCEKDADRVFHDSVLENRYDSTASTSNSLLENINFDQDGNILVGNDTNQIVLQHAGIEYQREMSNYIFENSSTEEITEIRDTYGLPQWQLSMIDFVNKNNNDYIVTIPLFKKSEFKSIIIYYNIDGIKKALIYKKKDVNNVINGQYNNMSNQNWIFPIIKFHSYNLILMKNDKKYESWLNSIKSNLERNYNIVERKMCPYVILVTDYWTTDSYDPSTYTETVTKYSIDYYVTMYFPCGSGSGDTGENTIGKSGGNSGNNNDPNNGKKNHPETKDCIKAILDFMVNDKVEEMINNNSLTDPCDPDKSTGAIIYDAVSGKCEDGVLNLGNVGDFLEDLGKNGGGKMNKTESFRNCKALNCLFDDMYDNGITNFCDLQNNFETDNKVIDLKVGNTSQFSNGRKAFTGVDSKTGRITIFFNPNLCVDDFKFNPSDFASDFLRTAKTIIHESVHADFWREVSNILPDGKTLTSINQSTFNETFQEFIDIVCTEGDVLTDQHEVMINSWIDKLSKDLWEYNGKVGNWEDYKYLAWLGLYPDEEHNECVEPLLSLQEYATLRDNYEQNIWNNSQTKLNEKNINDCLKNN